MRRGVSIAMVIFGILSILTGIWQFLPPFEYGHDPLHIAPAFIFGILVVIHVWLNRKPLVRYFKGLGWRWVFVGLGIILILGGGIVGPLLAVQHPA